MKKIKLIILILAISTGLSMNAAVQSPTNTVSAPVKTSVTQPESGNFVKVNALDVVNYPSKYLNKNVKIKAKFDKFSTLGLDYKPAMRSSTDYISFFIKRENVSNNIPLSEMKIFMKRSEAEKYIDLESGDDVEFIGKVFSTALGDPWIEVTDFKVICKQENNKNNKK